MRTAESLVHARGLTKRYANGFTAVDGVDFDVRPGEAFGFLGPNGAGKTSTMRMIACVSPVTDGELTVIGMDPRTQAREIKSRLGVVPQIDNLDTELTRPREPARCTRATSTSRAEVGAQARRRAARIRPARRAGQDQVEPLSGGMKRRLTIARALINEPELLILDEPTTGLDPQARHLLWERLYQLKRRGATLIITTHYMDEAEQLCDRLVVMDNGEDRGRGLAAPADRRALDPRGARAARHRLRCATTWTASSTASPTASRRCPTGSCCTPPTASARSSWSTSAQIPIESALVRRSSLEDVFLRLTGRSLIE